MADIDYTLAEPAPARPTRPPPSPALAQAIAPASAADAPSLANSQLKATKQGGVPTLTPRELARRLPVMTDDELAQMDHATLYAARQYVDGDMQNRISPFEHRAFAREASSENPLLAVPIAVASPLYQLSKAFTGARSKPALDQVTGALVGVGEGLARRAKAVFSR